MKEGHSETTQSPHLHSTCPKIDSRLAAPLLEDLSYLYRSLEGVSTFLHLQRCREPSTVAQPHAPHVDRFMGRFPPSPLSPHYVALENKPVMRNKLDVIIACMFTTPMQICCFCLCLRCCSFFLVYVVRLFLPVQLRAQLKRRRFNNVTGPTNRMWM